MALVACAARCEAIPWQLDERDGEGRWALEHGPEPNPDDPPGVLDGNDEVLWMVSDAGRRGRPDELPAGADCTVEIAVNVGPATAWVYGVALPGAAPRSPRRYVHYDAAADRIDGERVSIGFGAPTARHLALRSPGGEFGPNRLDRLKVRASAWFLGFIPLGRDEDDIDYRFAAWRAGPIRVLRREYQWVRLASWLRTPIFETETLVTRDAMTLPVRLRLNYPPTYFFSGIEIQAVLDFRDLRDWRVVTADGGGAVVGADGGSVGIDDRPAEWVALQGPEATLVLELLLGDSLASLAPAMVFRADGDEMPPEAVAGEQPGLGYRLTRWSRIDRGEHWFAARTYALAPDADLSRFAAERREPVRITATRLR